MTDYSSITEVPGSGLTAEQWARIHHRYALAAQVAGRGRLLEVACGAGVGLPALAHTAESVVGGDYMGAGLLTAQRAAHAAGTRVGLVRFDAHALPFAPAAYATVVCFEAVYYFRRLETFLGEARRVLADGGALLIGTENPDWPAFAPGRLSTRYWNIPELSLRMAEAGFVVLRCWGAFPVAADSPRRRAVAWARRLLLGLGLVPKHPGLRRRLQQAGYGRLHALPDYLDPTTLPHAPVVDLPTTTANPGFKVIYLLGTARA